MRRLWAVAMLVISSCQSAPIPDVPKRAQGLPIEAALRVEVEPRAWLFDARGLLKDDTPRRFAALPLDVERIQQSPALAHLTALTERLRAQAADGEWRTPVLLVMAPEQPVQAAYPPMYALGQAGFGPFSAAVHTPKGLGRLPFEPRVPLACGGQKPRPGETAVHPDDRGMADWNSTFDALLNGLPYQCNALDVWQSPEGMWAEWWTRWQRDRCAPPPRRPAMAPWMATSAALAHPPVGVRCVSATLHVSADLSWGALVESVDTLRALGFEMVRIGLR